jgi:tRNA A-37 threonylcarbamoyl transferase component Bud32
VAAWQSTQHQSLARLLDQRRVLPILEAVELVRQVARAVAVLHRAGRFHGQISPAAVNLDEQLRPTLETPRPEGAMGRGGVGDE